MEQTMTEPHDERVTFIHVTLKDEVEDVVGDRVQADARRHLGVDTGRARAGKLFVLRARLSEAALTDFARSALSDPITQRVAVGRYTLPEDARSWLLIARHPGVTDDEGASAETALHDMLDLPQRADTQHLFAQDLYLFERALTEEELGTLARDVLGNELIHHFEHGACPPGAPFLPEVHLDDEAAARPAARPIDLHLPDDELLALSRERVLSLSLPEMHAIRAYYDDPAIRKRRASAGLPDQATDCELEVFAQTWSEHCKHKEFNALIRYRDLDTGAEETIDSLFQTYIRGATEAVQERLSAAGQGWLVKVFSDNAGVVRVDDERLFVWKVETHNTPSALDPYGGAITGILGNNRDPLGTGRGGGRLLFNTNVLCFGSPFYDRPLLPGQLHPRRVFEGVRHGIEDGGNKSGVPTVDGAIVFDDRYAGKPLVFCGTGSILPARHAGRDAWVKEIDPGDLILMSGGRVGKDGIHGATFSSVEIDKHSPRTAVQIGSPITQKLLADFLEVATARGLVKCTTDNGAGGLSSSIGELAPLAGGAEVHLERVPLKYRGLEPWEIFVSESQERMTLVVEPARLEALMALSAEYEVETSEIGRFTDSGALDVRHDGRPVLLLDLDFLHDGVPRKHMEARWRSPTLKEPRLPERARYDDEFLALLGSLDICSRERVIRQYDHEVKGRTVIKPLMGPEGHAPQDAAVLRLDFDSHLGVAVSNGVLPRYGDLDAYWMSAGAFDEALRQIIAVGGRLPEPDAPEGPFWSVCDNFCVPDSDYDERGNPDGHYKLAQLVRMVRALYDMSTFFCIPMTSGKDSMKNDFRAEGVKISVPPTILYSMVARIDDVRRTVAAHFPRPGDWIVQIGPTRDERGGGAYYRLLGITGAHVPRVDMEAARARYRAVSEATGRGLIASCHDLSDGGLAVALAEALFGGGLALGCEVDLGDPDLPLAASLFSETHSRFVATVIPAHLEALQAVLGDDLQILGRVTDGGRLIVRGRGRVVMDQPTGALFEAWDRGLDGPAARTPKGGA